MTATVPDVIPGVDLSIEPKCEAHRGSCSRPAEFWVRKYCGCALLACGSCLNRSREHYDRIEYDRGPDGVVTVTCGDCAKLRDFRCLRLFSQILHPVPL